MQRMTKINKKIASIFLKIASPEKILEWSKGEVTKPETMNYRTQRSEKNGLFDERIFGPEKDYECYCGKYRGIRYKGIVCEKCGVEITRAIVRRERMGHIDLATPVSHIWFLRNIPSRIGLILGMNSQDLEKVVYFASYLVVEVNFEEKKRVLQELELEFNTKIKSANDEKTKDVLKELYLNTRKEIDSLQPGRVVDEVEYHKFSIKYGGMFEAKIGAEAIYDLLKNVNLEILLKKLEEKRESENIINREKLNKRISLIRSMIRSNIRPEWMFLTRIPVIPPALRPMVPLDGGRHASSDVNDLYRRVINRNNRLKKLKEIGAPEVILRNEKRILQEAIDALLDNTIRKNSQSSAGMAQGQRRALKSLSDNLKGKRGLFRSNLLGKRVDYSGRSVIVVGPELKLNQCGLPKHMALELFKPFVISKLIKRELAFNIRGASRLIDDGIPEVWEILEEVIKDKYVLLNRAPTLHRLGIQAFHPVLIEGNAIQIHPMVCTAFNADFDGDQMAVHVPLSEVAQFEAKEIMAADKNILKPSSGDPTVTEKLLDIVLGCFWATKIISGVKGENSFFPDINSAINASDFKAVDLRAKIKVMGSPDTKYAEYTEKPLEISVGRILFNETLPKDYPLINSEVDKALIGKVVNDLINKLGIENVTPILDDIKKFGFNFATYSGVTWGIDDIVVPPAKKEIVEKAQEEVAKIIRQYNDGFLSDDERYRKICSTWAFAKDSLQKIIPETLDKQGSVFDIWKSGARGSLSQIANMAAMKGLIVNAKGEEIEFPVISSNKEGLSPIEYFTTTHGTRKGLTDTSLNTAKAGYLTRKLFDVAQDIVVCEEDCKTKKFTVIQKKDSVFGISIPMWRKIKGLILSEDVKDNNEKVLFKKGHLLSKEDAHMIDELGIQELKVRSPLSCESRWGVCAHCYGMDLGKNKMVDIGEAVGTVAAQAIGEPGTQLTMRTFHAGGTASVGGDITTGLPRVEEIFERRKPKSPAIISKTDGTVLEIKNEGKDRIITILPEVGSKKNENIEYVFRAVRMPVVEKGQKVLKGQFLTDGSADLSELFKYAGRETTQEYIISQISKIYELQGAPIARKHIELIIRQMFSRIKIVKSGGTQFSIGDVVGVSDFEAENEIAEKEGLEKAEGESVTLGITEVSLSRKSFLSAASFQHTNKILINASIKGTRDILRGLKENVILGRLIPAGTGFEGSQKYSQAKEIEDESLNRFESNLKQE